MDCTYLLQLNLRWGRHWAEVGQEWRKAQFTLTSPPIPPLLQSNTRCWMLAGCVLIHTSSDCGVIPSHCVLKWVPVRQVGVFPTLKRQHGRRQDWAAAVPCLLACAVQCRACLRGWRGTKNLWSRFSRSRTSVARASVSSISFSGKKLELVPGWWGEGEWGNNGPTRCCCFFSL